MPTSFRLAARAEGTRAVDGRRGCRPAPNTTIVKIYHDGRTTEAVDPGGPSRRCRVPCGRPGLDLSRAGTRGQDGVADQRCGRTPPKAPGRDGGNSAPGSGGCRERDRSGLRDLGHSRRRADAVDRGPPSSDPRDSHVCSRSGVDPPHQRLSPGSSCGGSTGPGRQLPGHRAELSARGAGPVPRSRGGLHGRPFHPALPNERRRGAGRDRSVGDDSCHADLPAFAGLRVAAVRGGHSGYGARGRGRKAGVASPMVLPAHAPPGGALP